MAGTIEHGGLIKRGNKTPTNPLQNLIGGMYSGGGSGGGNGGSGGGGGGGGGSNPNANLNQKTQLPADLVGLSQEAKAYRDSLRSNSGLALDVAMQKIRDAREGGRTALQQSNEARGVASSPALGKYEDATQRQMAGAGVDVALGREQMLGTALSQGAQIAATPYQIQQGQQGLGLQAAGLDLQQQQIQAQLAAQAREAEFQQFMALLGAANTLGYYD